MTRTEVFDALVQRLTELGGYEPVTERAQYMLDHWWHFSDNSMDETGHETCRDWMDPEVVRLLDVDDHLRHGIQPSEAIRVAAENQERQAQHARAVR